MATGLRGFFGGLVQAVRPTQTIGVGSSVIVDGRLQEDERNPNLRDEQRWKTYSNLLVNTIIVGAGVRYFLNLAARSAWTLEPADDTAEAKEFADLATRMITDDPRTTWARVVRRAAMYKFYGFSLQEWTMRRDGDGRLTFDDVAPRAQRTVTRWDIDETGEVVGVTQTSPNTFQEIYLPRGKLVYVVDDALSDSPEGLGLFRHLASSSDRLNRYLELEAYGFEGDLGGVPVGRAPIAELDDLVRRGRMTEAQKENFLTPLKKFLRNPVRTGDKAVLLDSQTYETQDEAARPSNVPKWKVDLLREGTTGHDAVGRAVDRENFLMAALLGCEHLLLGRSGGSGSRALSEDKSDNFYLMVDSTLRELAEAFDDDLVRPLFRLNGWPEELRPRFKTEAPQFTPLEEVTGALVDLARAGATIEPDDPVVNDVRDRVNLPRTDTAAATEESLLGDSTDPDADEEVTEE